MFFALAIPIAPAGAQEVYGPSDFASEADGDEPVPLVEPEPCEEEVREDGAIVVCRELPEAERYMSPLPRPVEVYHNDVGGLREPPCWVTGKPGCIRMGYVPPYPPLVDTTAFPEQLSEEEAAAITAVEGDEDGQTEVRIGQRVTIDLTEDD